MFAVYPLAEKFPVGSALRIPECRLTARKFGAKKDTVPKAVPMKTINPFSRFLGFAVLLSSAIGLFAQGSLTPPGAPAPSMKTLAQIEPRIPISIIPTNITAPGSYYLTTNLVGAAGTNGITIFASNVTLDLMGFELVGAPGAVSGIYTKVLVTWLTNICIRNGTIRGWPLRGVDVSNARGCTLEKLHVSNNTNLGMTIWEASAAIDCIAEQNGGYGIFAGRANKIKGCIARANGTGISAQFQGILVDCTSELNLGFGFEAGSGSVVQNCTALGNSVGFVTTGSGSLQRCHAIGNTNSGFQLDTGLTVNECSAFENNGLGFTAYGGSHVFQNCVAMSNQFTGISIPAGSVIIGCAANGNGTGITTGDGCRIEGCVANWNGGGDFENGISTGIRSTVKECTTISNAASGIVVKGDSVVIDSHSSFNGRGSSAAGILVSGAGSRIEANHVRDNNGYGIGAGAGDLIIRNSAGNNSTNYFPSSGSNFGPIQSPATATNPFANFVL
jgi:hypothetical protein